MHDFKSPELYFNRELSWLAFNERVLEEALDPTNPLLERLKFLAIFASNLDEFFMVRVAGLKAQAMSGVVVRDNKAGLTPKEQLAGINVRTRALVQRMNEALVGDLLPQLSAIGITFLTADKLNKSQRAFIEDHFLSKVYPVLTPMAVDASRPFPKLADRSLNLGVYLEHGDESASRRLFALVQVPSLLPRYVELPTAKIGREFILLEDIIRANISTLFPGNRVMAVSPFRITRDADLLVEEGAQDLLEAIQEGLRKRKKGSAVRLEIGETMDEEMRETLRAALKLKQGDVYSILGPLGPSFLMGLAGLPKQENLRFEVLTPQPPRDFKGQLDVFAAIARRDLMMHHPYEAFDPVIRFVQAASEDPQVLAIKQTLYRVSGDSPIVNALARAAENGKQVTVLVELQARFDEERNIAWAKKLERAGCHVIFGINGLKTHAKITLVVRQEGDEIKRYVHLGTGNYNDTTAKLYTDLGMFTCREAFGEDATAFFNHLTGYAAAPELEQLVIAPKGLRTQLLALIDEEIKTHSAKRPGRIIAVMNALTDKALIQALYRASCAGVQVDLIVRGICCLRPGLPGVSENIHVRSIVGRFLEHSRVCYFRHGGKDRYFLSSADWMTRNMNDRVEILFPVMATMLKKRLHEVLELQLSDNVKAWRLDTDGTYRKPLILDEPRVDSQLELHRLASKRRR